MVVEGDGTRQKMIVATKTIHVKPGMGPFTNLVFAKEGHQRPGQFASDLVIVFSEIGHEKFKRNMHDLILSYKVSLAEALQGGAIHVMTIEQEKIEVTVDRIMTPETVKVIEGKGMPIMNNDPLGPIKQNY